MSIVRIHALPRRYHISGSGGHEITTVDAGNVGRLGFFCYMSKPKAPGYRQKRDWLAGRQLFLKNGFVQKDQVPPSFQLLVHRFEDASSAAGTPSFPTDREARQARCGDGLTMIRTPQCPYTEHATVELLQIATERGIPARVVVLASAREAQALFPSPYGTFGIVRDGRLSSCYLFRKELEKLLPEGEAS